MTLLLQSRAFHKIPPANLQAVFMRMQRMSFAAGDTVIRQGDEGDYFYAIVSGRCLVTRETPLNREGIKLAELGMGDTFGEEALISGAQAQRHRHDDDRRRADAPRQGRLQHAAQRADAALGGLRARRRASWPRAGAGSTCGCRASSSTATSSTAINVPLYFVRLKLKTLDPAVPYVVCCDNGRRSSAAAYILSERGFDTCVLRGGIAETDLAEALNSPGTAAADAGAAA